MKVLLLVPLLLLTACSAGGDDSLATAPSPAPALYVALDRGDGTPAQKWTLDCGTPESSTHPEAEAACAALDALDDPFAPLPEHLACTDIYGGPQEARVTGAWSGSEVDLVVRRSNGCEISQWDSLVPLLPAAT
jgi:hypothetical protein